MTLESLPRDAFRTAVLVNGCFDLLHCGHLDLLEFAGQFGPVTVALNSDSSVRALKGRGRPIVCQDERRRMLEAIRWVERVVVFYKATPLLPIVQLQPRVYVVGPDHATDCELCRVVVELGGQVRQSPAMRSVRTTGLVTRIKAAS